MMVIAMLDVKAFLEATNASRQDVIKVVREQYRGFDKSLLSKVENPDRYGVRLVTGAERHLLENITNTAPEIRKRDGHRFTCRVACRLPQGKFDELQRKLRKDGFETVQEGLNELIERYLND